MNRLLSSLVLLAVLAVGCGAKVAETVVDDDDGVRPVEPPEACKDLATRLVTNSAETMAGLSWSSFDGRVTTVSGWGFSALGQGDVAALGGVSHKDGSTTCRLDVKATSDPRPSTHLSESWRFAVHLSSNGAVEAASQILSQSELVVTLEAGEEERETFQRDLQTCQTVQGAFSGAGRSETMLLCSTRAVEESRVNGTHMADEDQGTDRVDATLLDEQGRLVAAQVLNSYEWKAGEPRQEVTLRGEVLDLELLTLFVEVVAHSAYEGPGCDFDCNEERLTEAVAWWSFEGAGQGLGPKVIFEATPLNTLRQFYDEQYDDDGVITREAGVKTDTTDLWKMDVERSPVRVILTLLEDTEHPEKVGTKQVLEMVDGALALAPNS